MRKALAAILFAWFVTFSVATVEAVSADSWRIAEEMLRLVNKQRARVGVAPLKLSQELMEATEVRAYEISVSFSHTRPNGKSFNSLVRDGRYTAGENIACGYSTAAETMEQWMDSTGHRANILRSDYTELGVGYFYAPNTTYKHFWVQIFKRPLRSAYRANGLTVHS